MLKRMVIVFVLLCLSCLAPPEESVAGILSGGLLLGDGGLAATGLWNNPNTSLTWEVTDPASTPSGKWRYKYTFSAPQAGASELLVELQFHVLIGDLVNKVWTGQAGQTAEVRAFSPSLDSATLPDLPSDVYGIKFNIAGSPTEVVAQFDTSHMPTWGDFYSCSSSAGPTAWNAGFTSADPTDPPDNGSLQHHILVPGPSVPEPLSVSLLAAGALLAVTRRRCLR